MYITRYKSNSQPSDVNILQHRPQRCRRYKTLYRHVTTNWLWGDPKRWIFWKTLGHEPLRWSRCPALLRWLSKSAGGNPVFQLVVMAICSPNGWLLALYLYIYIYILCHKVINGTKKTRGPPYTPYTNPGAGIWIPTFALVQNHPVM